MRTPNTANHLDANKGKDMGISPPCIPGWLASAQEVRRAIYRIRDTNLLIERLLAKILGLEVRAICDKLFRIFPDYRYVVTFSVTYSVSDPGPTHFVRNFEMPFWR